MADLLLLLVITQTILVPILGLIFLGIRNERKQLKLLLRDSIKALRIVGISKGRHL